MTFHDEFTSAAIVTSRNWLQLSTSVTMPGCPLISIMLATALKSHLPSGFSSKKEAKDGWQCLQAWLKQHDV
ncbi:hypothetical protein [Scytonema sp. NUACC21]